MFFPEENCRFCDHSATKTLYVYWLIKILIEQIKGSHSFNWIEAYQLISWITVLSANPNRLVAGFLRGAWPMLLVHKNKPTVSPVSNRKVNHSSVSIYSIEQTNRNVPLSNWPSFMSADVKRNLVLSYLFFWYLPQPTFLYVNTLTISCILMVFFLSFIYFKSQNCLAIRCY